MVLLVLQGGPGTLSMVLAYAQNGQAILVVRDSGGAADAVASTVLHGATDDSKFASEESQATLQQIAALHEASGYPSTASNPCRLATHTSALCRPSERPRA